MAKRIDSLVPGDEVTLKVHSSSSNSGYEMDATFLRIEGAGDDRVAYFSDDKYDTEGFGVYRYQNRWSIASDARRVSIIN